jgi:putative transposase
VTPCLQRTYVYRLYPNKTQEKTLGTHLEFCRRLYNAALEQRIFAYKECGVRLNGYRQCRDLTALRQEMPELVPEGMNAWCQQDAIRRLDLAYQAFFRRLKNGEKPGFPRCKGINRYRTLAYDLNGKGGGMRVQADGRGVAIAAIGKMRMRGGRGLPEDAKLLQGKLTRRAGGRWFLSVSMNIPKPESLLATGENVGVDVGVNVFAALSTGELIEGPNAFKNATR